MAIASREDDAVNHAPHLVLSDTKEETMEMRGRMIRTCKRWRGLACAAAVAIGSVAVPAAPAQAVASHMWPVCSSKVNEPGWRWETRIGGRYRHNPPLAVDINYGSWAEDAGRWVVASAAGRIEMIDRNAAGDYGRQVVLYHGTGDYTQYAHLDWVTSLGKGTRVKKGQLIGTIGKTGTSVPHLHYEQRKTPTGSLRKIVLSGKALSYEYPESTAPFFPVHIRPSCP